MSIRQFQPGDTVYSIGDASDVAYIVQSGQVEVTDASGKKRALGPGHLFGEVGLIKEAPRDETVRAMDAVALKACSDQELEALIYQSPQEVQQMMMHLVQQVTAPAPAPAAAPEPASAPAASGNDPMAAFYAGMERFTALLEQRCNAMAASGGATSQPAQVENNPVAEESLVREQLAGTAARIIGFRRD